MDQAGSSRSLNTNMLTADYSPISNILYDYFPKFFRIHFKEVPTREIDAYEFYYTLKSLIGGEIPRIENEGKNTLIVKISKEDQFKKIMRIRNILNHEVNVEIHDKLSYTQGLSFVNSWTLKLPEELDKLEEYLKIKNPGLHNIEHADFIKTREEKTLPIIVNFLGRNLPENLYIPAAIPIRPWINKPLRCKRCQEYGHSIKKCKKQITICANCSEEGHDESTCTATSPKLVLVL